MEIVRFILFVAVSMAFYEVAKSLIKDVFKFRSNSSKSDLKQASDVSTSKPVQNNQVAKVQQSEPEEQPKPKMSFIDRLKPNPAEQTQEDIYVEEEDDLMEIDGVTERMLPHLKDAGFNSYTDIEMAELADLKSTIQTSFPEVSDSELKLWRKQASFAAQERWDDLDKLKAMIQKARQSKRIQ